MDKLIQTGLECTDTIGTIGGGCAPPARCRKVGTTAHSPRKAAPQDVRGDDAAGLVHHGSFERLRPRAGRSGSSARGRRVLAARRIAALESVAAPYAQSALAVGLDVTDAEARETAVEAALDRFGRIDVLANIAGRGSLGAVEEFSPKQLREQMEVNFFAAAEMTRLVLPAMRAQASGHILQLTSIGGLLAIGGFGPYCASKFALEGWSEALRDEVRPFGVRVTIVEPGAFR